MASNLDPQLRAIHRGFAVIAARQGRDKLVEAIKHLERVEGEDTFTPILMLAMEVRQRTWTPTSTLRLRLRCSLCPSLTPDLNPNPQPKPNRDPRAAGTPVLTLPQLHS